MQRHSKIIAALMIICTILLLVIVIGVIYYMDLQNQRTLLIRQNAQNSQTVSNELNKTTVNYDTACLEYQKLYAAYTEIYEKAGTNAGLARYTAPDSAHDNPESCYH